MKVAFHTFGCKLNQCETEALASWYSKQGFSISTLENACELYIINTCTVTSKSEQKARRIIRGLARSHPGSLVVVTGCYAQLAADEIARLAPNVLAVAQEKKAVLFDLAGVCARAGLEKAVEELKARIPGLSRDESLFRFKVDNYQYHARAFCKIQDGCDNRCAYCRVPLARGGSVSLDPAVVLERLIELEQSGYREIVLTGVNICDYHYGPVTLIELLNRLLANLSQVRIRLSSLEPEQIDEELAKVCAHPAVCPHFHLPIQSGSDRVLRLMQRRYQASQVGAAVELLRKHKPQAFFSGDVIVGFPGEQEEDFQETCRLVESLGLAGLHVFTFSRRPGTRAWDFKEQIPDSVKKERSQHLKSLVKESFSRYVASFKGKELEFLLETVRREQEITVWQGLSANYLKAEIPDPGGRLQRGMIIKAVITEPGLVSKAQYL